MVSHCRLSRVNTIAVALYNTIFASTAAITDSCMNYVNTIPFTTKLFDLVISTLITLL
jgi:hypothetical protein